MADVNRIARIEIGSHRLPLDPPFPAAWDRRPRHAFPVTVYRVFDDEGRMGVGAGDAMRGLVDYLDLFVGEDPLDLDRHAAILDNIAFFDGRPWPLGIALWDLAGKIRGEPIWRMMGGSSDRVRPYASSGSLWSIDTVADRVARVIEAGFGALKLRFGRPHLEEDLAVVAEARRVAGDSLELMVDCNQGWRMPWDTGPPWGYTQARDVAERLADLEVSWMEEPVHRSDHEAMRRLRADGLVPIAGAEMTREPHELDILLERRCLDVYQPDVAVTCGFGRLRHFATEVVASGAVFSPHTWGSGIALVANAHLVAGTVGTPFLEYPYDPPVWTPERRDFVLSAPFEPDGDGMLVLGDAPGLGVTLDEERLAATGSDSISYR